jgi:hypothetical protein
MIHVALYKDDKISVIIFIYSQYSVISTLIHITDDNILLMSTFTDKIY